MQAPTWTEFLQCSVCTNRYDLTSVVPVSLTCGHTICKRCLAKLKTRACPYDKTPISSLAETLPPNTALLSLLGHRPGESNLVVPETLLSVGDMEHYKAARQAVEDLAQFLQPLVDQESPQVAATLDAAAASALVLNTLTKPMQKKLAAAVSCQLLEAEGRSRALKAARSIADRTITELLVLHQNHQQLSTLLWTAIRNRGCQFLGPVMQQDTLRFILKVMETGQYLSRKTIVMYVLQQLQNDYRQASKTSVGHVVQLLYRASCFNVEKRDEDSSLMQLKEEYRTYASLRREHDVQIVKIAMEAGLRISPEQWSSLLHGDHDHKSEMQSIIDKLITQGVASCGLNELIVAIGRAQDPYSLSERIIPPLEVLLKIDTNSDQITTMAASWSVFVEAMKALVSTLHCFSECMQLQSGRYKTGMCPNMLKLGECPRGSKCTYAHSEEEKEHYRSLISKNKMTPRSGEILQPPKPATGPTPSPGAASTTGSFVGDLSGEDSPYSSLDSLQGQYDVGLPLYDYNPLQSSIPDHTDVIRRAPTFHPAETGHLYGSQQYPSRAAPKLVYSGAAAGYHEQLGGTGYLGQYGHTHQSSYPQQMYDITTMSRGREGHLDQQATPSSFNMLAEMEAIRRKRDAAAQHTEASKRSSEQTLLGVGGGGGLYAHLGVGGGGGGGPYAHPEPPRYTYYVGDNPITFNPHTSSGVWVNGTTGESSLSSSNSSGMSGPQYFLNGESPCGQSQYHGSTPMSKEGCVVSESKVACDPQSTSSQATPFTSSSLSPSHSSATTAQMSSSGSSGEQSNVVWSGSGSSASHRSGSNASQGGGVLPNNIEELQERVRALELKLKEREAADLDNTQPADMRYFQARVPSYRHPPPPLPAVPYPGPPEGTYSLQRMGSPYTPYSGFTGPGGEASQHPQPQSTLHPQPQSTFHPQPQSAFHPQPQSAFHPQPQSAFHPQPQSTFHPQPQSQWREVRYPSLVRGSPALHSGFHHTSPQNTFVLQPSAPFLPSAQDPYQEQSDQMLAAYLQHLEQQKAMSYGRHRAQPPHPHPVQPAYPTEQAYSSYPRRPQHFQ